MEDKKYLLTYQKSDIKYEYEWFDTEKEMRGRIEEIKGLYTIIDAFHIIQAENIEY